MIVAVGAPGDAEDGRSLDTFGNGQSIHQLPPVFEVGDEAACIGKGFADDFCVAAQLFGQRTFAVPAQDLGR